MRACESAARAVRRAATVGHDGCPRIKLLTDSTCAVTMDIRPSPRRVVRRWSYHV